MTAVDETLLQTWANDPELAIANIKQVFAILESPEPENMEWVTEVFENCGAPKAEDAGWLASQPLVSKSDEAAYWAATLLGRLGDEASAQVSQLEKLANDTQRSEHVRKRATWALSKISGS
jgi:hypothetical protein